ncbi:MAG TPA: glycerophosphodiester phosphodiesterase [Candidatus Saccharimonadia bacterium]|nr:glycerophosphodiester phosphodiesterase [Candidatus Saccharimonadia bacterium]
MKRLLTLVAAEHPLVRSGESAVLIGHRGASARRRENTLAAFELAMQLGAGMIEFDARRTADGVLVVHHNRRIRGRRISRLTYARLQTWRHSRHVPTLEQVLQLAAGRVRLDIELKEAGYEAEVIALVRRYVQPDSFVMSSFLEGTVRRLKQLDSELCVGLLVGRGLPKFIFNRLSNFAPARRVARSGADFLACHYSLADLGVLGQMARRGVPVMIWTVNDARRLRRYLADPRVRGVISNLPPAAEPYLPLAEA